MMLREDIARAARAAVWARAAGMWDGSWRRERREDILWGIADFFAHLRAGAVEVHGDLPGEEVHPWDCFLRNDYSYIYMRCPGFTIHAHGEVPKTAVEAALAELRSRARAAGMVIWNDALIARPAPPHYVRTAREVVRAVRSKLGDLDLAAVMRSEELDAASVAAALAAIEAGNWVATIHCFRPSIPSMRVGMEVEVYRYAVAVRLRDGDREVYARIFAARAPRSMRSAFATAYAKWYGRLASFSVERQLEAIGV
jgi:hypothetical protein